VLILAVQSASGQSRIDFPAFNGTAEQAAEKLLKSVIPSEARNLSFS
jgi:hypothetical protein